MFDHKTSREHMSNTLPRTSLGHVVGLRCKWGVCAMNTQCTYQLALGGSRSNVREDATDESQIYLVWRSWVSFKLTLIMASGWQIMHTVHLIYTLYFRNQKKISKQLEMQLSQQHICGKHILGAVWNIKSCMNQQSSASSVSSLARFTSVKSSVGILTHQSHISQGLLTDWLTDITSLESVMWR